MILVLIVLIIYFAATAIISIVLQKKSKNLEGYYLGQRNLPWPVVMLTFAATWIGASSTLGKSGLAYEIGISAVLPTFATVFAFAVFCLFAGRIQRIGQKYHILSIPDLITKRFGRLPALIASAIIGWTVIGTAGTQMVASSKILQMVMADDWEISYQTALVVTTVIVIAYTTLSGFYGVAYTDTLQGILLIVVIGVALPVAALTKIGGPAQLVASLPKHYFELKFDRSIRQPPVSVFSRVRVPGRTRPELPAVVMRLAFVFLFRLGAATNIFSDSPQRVKCKSVSRLPRIRDRAWYPSIWSPLCMTQVFLSVWVSPQERAWARHMKHMTPKRSCITCPAVRLILPSGVCGRLLLQSFGR